jgi:hypothetical protein
VNRELDTHTIPDLENQTAKSLLHNLRIGRRIVLFPKHIFVAVFIHIVFLIIGIWLIDAVGKGLFQFLGASIKVLFTLIVFVAVIEFTIWVMNYAFCTTKYRTSYLVGAVLAIIYWLSFSGSSIISAQNINGSYLDEEKITNFVFIYLIAFPVFNSIVIGQLVGSRKQYVHTDGQKHKKIEESKIMNIELTKEAFLFLFSVGSFAMKELGERWRIRRVEQQKVDEKSEQFTIDLGEDSKINNAQRIYLESELQSLSAQQIRNSIDSIKMLQALIVERKQRKMMLDLETARGRERSVNAEMEKRQIDKENEESVKQIEKEILFLGWLVERHNIS